MIDNKVLEVLARVAHDDIWGHWMRYLFSKAIRNDDGSVTIPAGLVERWERQTDTAFADLPESEKASDFDQADKVVKALNDMDYEICQTQMNTQPLDTIDATPPYTVKVDCASCPLRSGNMCGFQDRAIEHWGGEGVTFFHAPPDWCPIRKGGVTVKLEV